MSDLIKKLSEPLGVDDIEFRIGSVGKAYNGAKPKGFSLLAYKTARTDVKRFNEVLGINWKNEYFYDSKGILCCAISVYNPDTKEWISRSDVGVESFAEKEKGSYSDAFKRAGFKWGVGTELYNFPFVWINWNDYTEYQGKFTPKSFDSKSIEIKDYVVKNGNIKNLTLVHKGNVIFQVGKVIKPKEEQPKPQPRITPQQITELETLLHEKQVDRNKFFNWLGVNNLGDIAEGNFAKVKETLLKK